MAQVGVLNENELATEVHTWSRLLNGFGPMPSQVSMSILIDLEPSIWDPLIPMRATVRYCSSCGIFSNTALMIPWECRSKACFVAVHVATRAKRVGKSGQLSMSTSRRSAIKVIARRTLYGVAALSLLVVIFAGGSLEPKATTCDHFRWLLGPDAGVEALGCRPEVIAVHVPKVLTSVSCSSPGFALSISPMEGILGSTPKEATLGGSGSREPKAHWITVQRSELPMTDGVEARQLHRHKKNNSQEWMATDSKEMWIEGERKVKCNHVVNNSRQASKVFSPRALGDPE